MNNTDSFGMLYGLLAKLIEKGSISLLCISSSSLVESASSIALRSVIEQEKTSHNQFAISKLFDKIHHVLGMSVGVYHFMYPSLYYLHTVPLLK